VPRTPCVACTTPAIDAASRDPKRSNRAIAREFKISEAAVRTHRTNHVTVPKTKTTTGAQANTPRPGGRPRGSTKFTDDRVRRFLAVVRAGSTFRAAALSVGWSVDSFQRYRAEHAVFASQVEEADGLAEVQLVATVRQAAQTDWRAAMELLGRRWPETWGRHDRVDVELKLQLRRLAAELELDPQELVAEAERLVARH
jgi:hypothetical protein